MPKSIWEIIEPHFSRKEPWGDSDKMNGLLLLLLFALREEIPWPFVIHYGTLGKHSSDSQHPSGNAVDGHFITDIHFYDQILRVESALDALQVAGRVGLGLYPAWNTPGIHIDVRGRKARWGWIGEMKPDGKTKKYCTYEHAKMFALAGKRSDRTW